MDELMLCQYMKVKNWVTCGLQLEDRILCFVNKARYCSHNSCIGLLTCMTNNLYPFLSDDAQTSP